jgi:hypothetical protein
MSCVSCVPFVQVGKLLAELVREPVAPGAGGGNSSRREVNAGSESGTGGHMGEWASSTAMLLLAFAGPCVSNHLRTDVVHSCGLRGTQ